MRFKTFVTFCTPTKPEVRDPIVQWIEFQFAKASEAVCAISEFTMSTSVEVEIEIEGKTGVKTPVFMTMQHRKYKIIEVFEEE